MGALLLWGSQGRPPRVARSAGCRAGGALTALRPAPPLRWRAQPRLPLIAPSLPHRRELQGLRLPVQVAGAPGRGGVWRQHDLQSGAPGPRVVGLGWWAGQSKRAEPGRGLHQAGCAQLGHPRRNPEPPAHRPPSAPPPTTHPTARPPGAHPGGRLPARAQGRPVERAPRWRRGAGLQVALHSAGRPTERRSGLAPCHACLLRSLAL